MEIHSFCDASISSCIYVVSTSPRAEGRCLGSNSYVAPFKMLTLLNLEIAGTKLLATILAVLADLNRVALRTYITRSRRYYKGISSIAVQRVTSGNAKRND